MAIFCNSYDWSKSFNTKKHLSKIDFKYIFFPKLPFWKIMHCLSENKNIPMRGKHIAP